MKSLLTGAMRLGGRACGRGNRPQLERFWRESNGAAAVEHALFIALIIGTALLAIEAMGLLAGTTFDTAAGHLSGDSVNTTRHSGQLAEHVRSEPESPAHVTTILSAAARMWVLLIVCPLSALLWYLLYRRHGGKSQAQEEPDELDEGLKSDHNAIFVKRHGILRFLSEDVGILFNSRMLVRHLMSPKLTTIAESAPAQLAHDLMQDEKIRHLMVCDKDDRLLGVISDRDLRKSSAKTAKELMTPEPITISLDSPVSPAITLLINRRISCLPVLDDGRLAGVLTSTDLMMTLQCTLQALQKVAAEIAESKVGDQQYEADEVQEHEAVLAS